MDIGVFGPSKVLGAKGAEELVFKLANILREIDPGNGSILDPRIGERGQGESMDSLERN